MRYFDLIEKLRQVTEDGTIRTSDNVRILSEEGDVFDIVVVEPDVETIYIKCELAE